MKILRTRFFESGLARYCFGGVIGLLLGMLVVIACSLEFDSKLSINTVLQALVTIGVSVVVAFLIQRWLHTDKLEKEFLMDKLKKLAELAEQLREQDQAVKVTEQAAIFKKMNMLANSIRDVVETLARRNFPKAKFDFTADVQELKKLATDTPISDIRTHAGRAKCSSAVRDGINKLADDRWEEIVAKTNALCARILVAQMYAIGA